MSRRLTLIVTLCAMVAAVGGYFLVRYILRNASLESRAEKVVISNIDKEDILSMQLTGPDGSLSVHRKADLWVADTPNPIILDQQAVDDIAWGFARLYAEKIIDKKPNDVAGKGLEPARVHAWASLDDGSEKSYFIGDPIRNAKDLYYFMVEGDEKLYSARLEEIEFFFSGFTEVRERRMVRIPQAEVVGLKLQRGSSSLDIRKEGDGFVLSRAVSGKRAVDPKAMEKLLEAVRAVEAGEFVDDAPKDLAAYGLKSPTGICVVTGIKAAVSVFLGADKDSQNIFVRTSESGSVYAVPKASLLFMDTAAESLLEVD